MDSLLIFIIVLGILVFFHELGHFLIARLFGVGVEKFSLGFGPRLFGKTIGHTDYRVSLIPLGGYVKMMGEEPDADLDPEKIPLSFTHKHLSKRSLIVAAGPVFNFFLAIIIFTGIFYFIGLTSIKPFVRNVDTDSPAAVAGIREDDRIRSINGVSMTSWLDIDKAVEKSQGQSLSLEVERNGQLLIFDLVPRSVNARNLLGDDVQYFDLGISGVSKMTAIVDSVVEGMPADLAGLRPGDKIVAIDDRPIERWEQMHDIVSQSQGRALMFKIERGEVLLSVEITPQQIQEPDPLGVKQTVYRIGIRSAGVVVPPEDKMTVELTVFQSIGNGLSQSWFMVKTMGYFIVKLIKRQAPMETLGGPIRIAQMAQREAEQGVVRLLNFIAALSINLAVLNLLPIPVLDGGHLLFFLIEAVQRRPVSIRTREMAQQVGIFILMLLMVFVFYNDISLTFFK
jgi:regulator of sigma E protease